MMKKILTLFILTISLTQMFAQSGNEIIVNSFQEVNLFAQDKIVDYATFPDENVNYQNVTMLLTMGCMNGDSCSHWDYDLDVYVGDSTGVMDSSIISIDTVSQNPLVLDTTWNVFEIIEWHELGRYVTPYGNYMNWNQNGFDGTWEQYLKYDVTDFSPLLRGNQPIRIYFHGWQKGFRASVDFYITEGNPTRDVIEVENVYRGGGYSNFTQFDSTYTPEKTIVLPDNADEAKLRVIITGHGQAGEFTPIQYDVKANNSLVKTQDIWKECDEIAVSPQGGTWLISRANWCPGEAVIVDEFELTDFIQESNGQKTLNLDIDLTDYAPQSGASYSLSAQLISYESYRRDYDLVLDEIIAPSTNTEFVRFNPICNQPIVRVKNYGKQTITYFEIEYWIDHTQKYYFEWTGSLASGEAIDVELPSMNWTNLDSNNPMFFANVTWPNNLPDQFPYNNQKEAEFELPEILNSNSLRVRLRANNKPEENAFTITDKDGVVIADESTFNASTFNTFDYLLDDGCYVFEITDYGTDWECGDGLNWWYNTQTGNESSGFVEFRNGANNTLLKSFQSDFGGSLKYEFLINTALEDITSTVNLLPGNHPELTAYTSPTGEEFWQVYDTIWISEDKVIYSTTAPTSIGEVINDLEFSLYPNPTNQLVHILINTTQNLSIDYRVQNMIGQTVFTGNLNTNQVMKVNTSNLISGVYSFVFDIEGTTITKRIMIID